MALNVCSFWFKSECFLIVPGISKPSDEIFPFDFADTVAKSRNRFSCDIVANERGLLGLFLAKICKIDPDILVGHDLLGLDFDILLSRISANKVPLWSRLGRRYCGGFVCLLIIIFFLNTCSVFASSEFSFML